MAGEIVTRLSAEHRAPIIPVDSEHSAIFQCLTGEHSAVEKVILTASGGPFLHRPAEELERVSVEEALNHPSWCMGAKVTIDSASLMNNGFRGDRSALGCSDCDPNRSTWSSTRAR